MSSTELLPVGHRFDSDEAVMDYALKIAAFGQGRVEPNPMVGAVIVDRNRTLAAAGWHQACGQDHAEIAAIRSASDTRGMRLFVTLEPCSHHGKTPPCADAVIAAGFHDVVIGCPDPAPHTRGQGLSRLKNAGVPVTVGVRQKAAQELIRPFTMLQTQGRPWVHAKWAMTLDGRIATSTGHSKWISSPASRAVVHALRGRMDAIITGSGTVQSDDPLLTARPPGPRTAARLVVDSHGRSVTPTSRLAATVPDAPLIVAATDRTDSSTHRRLADMGAELIILPQDESGRVCVRSLLKELGRRNMTNVLLECGGRLTGSFFDARLIDEVHVFVAPRLAGGERAVSPVGGRGRPRIPESSDLVQTEIRQFDGDVFIHGRLRRPDDDAGGE